VHPFAQIKGSIEVFGKLSLVMGPDLPCQVQGAIPLGLSSFAECVVCYEVAEKENDLMLREHNH